MKYCVPQHHPQTDGQTEVTNWTLSTLLRVLIKKNIKECESAYPSPSTPTTAQDIQLPASPPSRLSMVSTRCPHWTSYPYHSKSAQTWTRVTEPTTSRRCMKIQGTPLSSKYNDLRPTQRQQESHDIQQRRSCVATPLQGPLPQQTQLENSTVSRLTIQSASTLQK